MVEHIKISLRITVVLLVITCGFYPTLVWAIGQVAFRYQADGSRIRQNGKVVGSELIGQNFAGSRYFHPRPSAAGNDGYDGTASGGSNYGPTNQKLYDRVKASVDQFRKENPEFTGPVPADAVTASASGLDPEISLENAIAQAARVAKA